MPFAICFKMAAIPLHPDGLVKLAAAAADPLHSPVAPILVCNDKTILDSAIVQSIHLPKMLLEGYKLGQNTQLGNTDWIRDVDDLTTNIVAISVDKLRELMAFGIQTYYKADTLLSILPGSSIAGANFVVWAKAPFEYRGLLKPLENSSYYNAQIFRYTPTITMHVDNWGEEYAREPDK